MGNYNNLEVDFIQRTLNLVEQYDEMKELYEFDEQYNHTLLINCLLGLAILPKEKVLNHAPKEKLPILKSLGHAGIVSSKFHDSIKDSIGLIEELRDSAAHFNIKFISNNDDFLIDRIQFINDRMDVVIADFASEELLPFVKWFAKQLIININKFGQD